MCGLIISPFFFLDENLLNKNTELKKKKVQSDRSQKMKKT